MNTNQLPKNGEMQRWLCFCARGPSIFEKENKNL